MNFNLSVHPRCDVQFEIHLIFKFFLNVHTTRWTCFIYSELHVHFIIKSVLVTEHEMKTMTGYISQLIHRHEFKMYQLLNQVCLCSATLTCLKTLYTCPTVQYSSNYLTKQLYSFSERIIFHNVSPSKLPSSVNLLLSILLLGN